MKESTRIVRITIWVEWSCGQFTVDMYWMGATSVTCWGKRWHFSGLETLLSLLWVHVYIFKLQTKVHILQESSLFKLRLFRIITYTHFFLQMWSFRAKNTQPNLCVCTKNYIKHGSLMMIKVQQGHPDQSAAVQLHTSSCSAVCSDSYSS